MYKLFITLIFAVSINLGIAQTIPVTENDALSKFTIEPAIGTRLNSLMGNPNLQVANLIQYNHKKKISLIAHTAFSTDMNVSYIPDVRQNYSYSFSQKVGLGTSFNTKRATNAFFVLTGLTYSAYSGTIKSEQLPESITTNTRSFFADYGVMYNLKSGRKKYFLSSRLYMPLQDGLMGGVENTTLELGVGVRLNHKAKLTDTVK